MQKYLYIVLLPALIMACTSGRQNNDAGKKRVFTVTIEPQRYFLDRIAGETPFTVNTLVPPGSSPETYEPAPSVMIDLGKSDIYFMVGGLGFENAWSQHLSKNNPNVTIVDCSEGIDLMKGFDPDHGSGHDSEHSHQRHAADDHGHAHSHGALDPHVWSSPGTVKSIAGNMLKALVKADPDNEETFRANYNEFSVKIHQTDSLIRDLLKDAPSKSFIIYHPSLGYFAREYGLQQYSIEFEGKSPSPSQIKEIVDIARKEKINTVFIEKGFDSKNASVIAKEIGAKVFEIDPLRYEWDEELVRIATILAGKTNE